MIERGTFLFFLAAVFLIAGFAAAASLQFQEWSAPFFVGAVASVIAGFYQRWWLKGVFDEAHRPMRKIPVRVHRRKSTARIRS
jgi:hypothetical protein